MPDQDDLVEILKLENLRNVRDVCVESYFWAGEMQALTTAGTGGCVDPMAHCPQSVGDVLPYPATMPGAVYQYEGGGLRSGRTTLVLGCGVLRKAEGRQSGAAPPQ